MDTFSRASLLKCIQNAISNPDADIIWQHANMRKFELIPDQQNPEKIHICEMVPTREYSIANDAEHSFHVLPQNVRDSWRTDPNGFERKIQNQFSNAASSIRASDPFRDLMSARTPALEPMEAVDDISQAINTNTPYRPALTPFTLNPEDLQKEADQRNTQTQKHLHEQKAPHKKSMSEDIPALFPGLRNMFGPLEKEQTERLLSYYNAPSTQTWDSIARIIICTGKTSITPWSIWTDIDPDAPTSLNPDETWPRIPSLQTFLDILMTASEKPEHKPRSPVTPQKIMSEKITAENRLRDHLGLPLIGIPDMETPDAHAHTATP